MTVYNIRSKKSGKRIDRTTPFGNPFIIGRDGDREEVIRKFREYFYKNKELRRLVRKELRGHDLLCWCKPLACHGDVIIEYLEKRK